MIEDFNYFRDPRVREGLLRKPYKVLSGLYGPDRVLVRFDEELVNCWIEDFRRSWAKANGKGGDWSGCPEFPVSFLGPGDLPPEHKLDPYVISASASWELCPQCRGSGSMVNPSIDSTPIGADDFERDPQLYSDYASGAFNVKCSKCNGKRVVLVLGFPPDLQGFIDDYEEDQRRFISQQTNELAMGC